MKDSHARFLKLRVSFTLSRDIHYLMRRQVGLEVTNGAPTDYRRVGLTVRLIGIIRIMLRRNVVYAHPATGRTRIGLSAAP